MGVTVHYITLVTIGCIMEKGARVTGVQLLLQSCDRRAATKVKLADVSVKRSRVNKHKGTPNGTRRARAWHWPQQQKHCPLRPPRRSICSPRLSAFQRGWIGDTGQVALAGGLGNVAVMGCEDKQISLVRRGLLWRWVADVGLGFSDKWVNLWEMYDDKV